MKAEAQANADEDKKAKERIDKINEADSLIFNTEKQLKELGDKLSADKKAPIEAALGKLKDAHKAQDLTAIDTAMDELNKAFHAASEEMYKNTGAQPGGANPSDFSGGTADSSATNNSSAQDVSDADFEEVK